jgi:hypothetical protein
VAALGSEEWMLLKGTGDIVPQGMGRVIEVVEIGHIDRQVFQVLEKDSNENDKHKKRMDMTPFI